MKSAPNKTLLSAVVLLFLLIQALQSKALSINEVGYFESPTLNVMVFDDYYPEGHQGGISIIQHGSRIATNGDVRISRAPGQWQAVPKKLNRQMLPKHDLIVTELRFPDDSKILKGFNPIPDPEIAFNYKVEVKGINNGVEVIVHFEHEIPTSYLGKIRFNLELFPALVFGKSFQMDETPGQFPRQANGALYYDPEGKLQIEPLASGHQLTIAPEDERICLTITSENAVLDLLDGRGSHNNGWFIVSSAIPAGTTQNALRWKIIGHPIPDWEQPETILVSQVGYHPDQKKIAYIECPKDTRTSIQTAVVEKFNAVAGWKTVISSEPTPWKAFLRYNYGILDFSEMTEQGLYRIRYNGVTSHAFQINQDVYKRHVWQPTIEYFLPVQMCHMRINEKYRVWHDLCHEDDALMAPVNINHFDGYEQGTETLTSYHPLEHVPNLNKGGWHDAGDYDLRIESQSNTVYMLAQAYEYFQPAIDQTWIDQDAQIVEIHHPDNKNDILQQIEHGLLSILPGYESLGRLYRGIITPSLRQYVLLGDAGAMTDGIVHKHPSAEANKTGVWYQKVSNSQTARMDPHENEDKFEFIEPKLDDRLVFTEENPSRSLQVSAALACASRVIRTYDANLARRTLSVAEALWETYKHADGPKLLNSKATAALELAKTTHHRDYKDFLLSNQSQLLESFEKTAPVVAKAVLELKDSAFTNLAQIAAAKYATTLENQQQQTPFGVPYQPNIWGDGWKIQQFGTQQYFLHKTWPDLFPKENLLRALDFILGCHPGPNGASFVSGVGAHSVLTAYGVNRADGSFIPGGSVSGTALIRPDFPELLDWPYLWQQTEYVMGGGATNFLFLVLAADALLSE